MTRSKRMEALVAGILALMAGAACSSKKATVSTIPTPSISIPAFVPSIAASGLGQAQAALCQAIVQRSTFAGLQASPGLDQSQVNDALDQARGQLDSAAQQLTSEGRSDLASFAQGAATSVDTLKQALAQSGGIPEAVQAAVAAASAALAQLPAGTCPS